MLSLSANEKTIRVKVACVNFHVFPPEKQKPKALTSGLDDFLLVETIERIPSVRADTRREFRKLQYLFSLKLTFCGKNNYRVTDFNALSAYTSCL